MNEFENAVEFVLAHEGGLNENPNDMGGISNFGISLRFLREVKEEHLRRYGIFEEANQKTIRELTLDQAKRIYLGEFWEGNRFEEISSQPIRSYLFDMVVSLGLTQAIKILQRACAAILFTRNCLRDDGIIGDTTIELVNSMDRILLPVIVGIRAEFYRCLAARAKEEVFLDGWLNRAYSAL